MPCPKKRDAIPGKMCLCYHWKVVVVTYGADSCLEIDAGPSANTIVERAATSHKPRIEELYFNPSESFSSCFILASAY